ncbi:hypothetical protein SRHO_G00123540 [Serrasalmus rhombeus]
MERELHAIIACCETKSQVPGHSPKASSTRCLSLHVHGLASPWTSTLASIFPRVLFAKQEYEVGVPAVEKFVQHCRRAWQKACASLLIIKTETTKLVADCKRCPVPTFCTEQQVWLSAKDLLLMESKKLAGM